MNFQHWLDTASRHVLTLLLCGLGIVGGTGLAIMLLNGSPPVVPTVASEETRAAPNTPAKVETQREQRPHVASPAIEKQAPKHEDKVLKYVKDCSLCSDVKGKLTLRQALAKVPDLRLTEVRPEIGAMTYEEGPNEFLFLDGKLFARHLMFPRLPDSSTSWLTEIREALGPPTSTTHARPSTLEPDSTYAQWDLPAHGLRIDFLIVPAFRDSDIVSYRVSSIAEGAEFVRRMNESDKAPSKERPEGLSKGTKEFLPKRSDDSSSSKPADTNKVKRPSVAMPADQAEILRVIREESTFAATARRAMTTAKFEALLENRTKAYSEQLRGYLLEQGIRDWHCFAKPVDEDKLELSFGNRLFVARLPQRFGIDSPQEVLFSATLKSAPGQLVQVYPGPRYAIEIDPKNLDAIKVESLDQGKPK